MSLALFLNRVERNLRYMFPGLAAGLLVYLLLYFPRKKRLAAAGLGSGKLREAAMCLFWMYGGGMAVITLVPEPGWVYFAMWERDWPPYFDFRDLAHRLNLIPFSQPDGLFNIVGNVIMFLPFGFFAALLWRGFTGKRAALMGLGITLGIECWQILLGRYFDVDDIILNALGVFLGYLICRLLEKRLPRLAARFRVFRVNEELS